MPLPYIGRKFAACISVLGKKEKKLQKTRRDILIRFIPESVTATMCAATGEGKVTKIPAQAQALIHFPQDKRPQYPP